MVEFHSPVLPSCRFTIFAVAAIFNRRKKERAFAAKQQILRVSIRDLMA